MPLKVFNRLGLDDQNTIKMRLLMMDRSIKTPDGVIYHILVKVDKFVFSANFGILDFWIDIEVFLYFVDHYWLL